MEDTSICADRQACRASSISYANPIPREARRVLESNLLTAIDRKKHPCWGVPELRERGMQQGCRFFASPLVSKLFDGLRSNANPIPCVARREFESNLLFVIDRKKHPCWGVFSMAERKGFEPLKPY